MLDGLRDQHILWTQRSTYVFQKKKRKKDQHILWTQYMSRPLF